MTLPPKNQPLAAVVSSLLVAACAIQSADADLETATSGARPKTVRELILDIGKESAATKQLKVKIVGEAKGKDLSELPEKMEIDLRYDKAGNRIRLVIDSKFSDGTTRKRTVYANKERAAVWSIGTGEGEEKLRAAPLEPTLVLPNPWALPVKLAFPGLFAESLHGYAALAREFSRSRPINSEPDEDGLLWFDLKPSSSSGVAMRNDFNAGLKAKAGFVAEGGWLKEMEVSYVKPEAVLNLKVVEQTNKLTEEDVADFGFPDEVTEAIKNRPKPERSEYSDGVIFGRLRGAGKDAVDE